MPELPMEDPRPRAPKPARLPGVPARGPRPEGRGERPGRRAREPEPARPAGQAPAEQPEAEEVTLETAEGTWRARVLGRTARTRGAAPLMLLGFWEGHAEGAHARETLVVGRRLGDLTEEALAEALARARPPRREGQERPFFQDTDQGRGGRGEER